MFVTFAHGDDANGFIGYNVNDHHDDCIKQSVRDHALLAVVVAAILGQHQRPLKNAIRVGEVVAVLPQILLALGFVPREVH